MAALCMVWGSTQASTARCTAGNGFMASGMGELGTAVVYCMAGLSWLNSCADGRHHNLRNTSAGVAHW